MSSATKSPRTRRVISAATNNGGRGGSSRSGDPSASDYMTDVDSTREKLQRQIGTPIENAIIDTWLKGTGRARVTVEQAPHEGATDAIIMRAEAHLDFHVKFSVTDVPRERDGYEVLVRSAAYGGHVVAPLFQELAGARATPVLMLVPYQNARTLNAWLTDPEAELELVKQVYRNFTETSRTLWTSTRVTRAVSLRELYWGRVRHRAERLAQLLEVNDLSRLDVVVNGVSLGTFGSIFAGFQRRVSELARCDGCTTHGDENSTNIMVFNEAIEFGQPDRWVVIDYVNTGECNDWVFSIAKMLQDWRFDHVLRLAAQDENVRRQLASTHELDGEQLLLSYDVGALEAQRPAICRELEEMTLAMAEATAQDIGEGGSEWRERLRVAEAAVGFGSAPLRAVRDPFTLPVLLHRSLAKMLPVDD